MDSWKRFKEESLPDKESFYNELNNEHITDKDYEHAQKVCDTFKVKTLGKIMTYMVNLIQYYLMYLKTLEINPEK